MAAGDAAQLRGYTVYPASTLANRIAELIALVQDDLAAKTGDKGAPIPLALGGTGANSAAAARAALGLIIATSLTGSDGKLPTYSGNGTLAAADPTANNHVASKRYVDTQDAGVMDELNDVYLGQLAALIYSRDITTTRRSLWISSDGLLGYASSRRAVKQNIEDVEWTDEQLRAIPVVHYRYRKAVAAERRGEGKAPVEVGTIADDLHDLGLWEFVIYEDEKPRGVHYELLGLAALALAQRNAERLDALEARLNGDDDA